MPLHKHIPRVATASLLALLLLPTALYAQVVAQQDSLALVALYDATGGDEWTNNTGWKISPVRTWYGVADGTVRNGRVTWLDLGDNNLVGSIPPEIGNLTGLEVLRLDNNTLDGVLPAVMGDMTSLRQLQLFANAFTGEIPAELGKLTNLTSLSLSLNGFTGEIPKELGDLTNLIQLELNKNWALNDPVRIGLTGEIPAELGNLTNLQELYLDENRLTGEIPKELGALTELRVLRLEENTFTGAVPPELAQLINLERLFLNENSLDSLPDLSPLTLLEDRPSNQGLRVQDNQLTFEHLEPNIALFGGIASRYSPQDNVGEAGTRRLDEGDRLELHIPVGGAANEYQWYLGFDSLRVVGLDTTIVRIFSEIEGATSDTYVVEAVGPEDQGIYELRITNTVVGQLTLRSRPIRVDVSQAPTVVKPILDRNLQVGGEALVVDLNTVFEDPNGDPLTYTAQSADSAVARADLMDETLLVVTLAENPTPRARVRITVTANDATFQGDDTPWSFDVTVNYAPTVAQALQNTVLPISADGFRKNLVPVFSDRDDDSLAFMVTSSKPTSVTSFVAPDSTGAPILFASLVSPTVGDNVLLTITADDGRGGSVAETFDVLIDEAPKILVTSKDEAPGNAPHKIEALITDNQPGTRATVYVRQAGEVGFTPNDMTPSGDDSFTAETEVGETGIELYIVATDTLGLQTRDPSEDSTYRSVQILIPDPGVQSTPQPGGGQATNYRLISIPLDLQDKRPSAVLEDDLGRYDPSQWRFYEPGNASSESFSEFPNTSAMEAGKAFWLLVKEAGKIIDTGAGLTEKTDETFNIGLQPGWNAIGNPFNYSIPVRNIQLQGRRAPRLWHYDEAPSWRELSSDEEILPFEGYAVFNDGDNPVELLICPTRTAIEIICPLFDPLPDTRQDALADTLSWSIRIVAQSRHLRDTETVAAVAAKASAAWDRIDRPEPPRSPGDFVSAYFPHPEWQTPTARYSRDARPTPADGAVWPFDVTTTLRDKVELTFEGLAGVPPDFEAWLVDDVLKIQQDLRQANRYAVAGSEAPRSLKLVVGKPGFIAQELQESQEIPTTFELLPNFPNPFNPATTLRYGVPEAAAVSLVVYNMLGQKVATLLGGVEQPAGYHAVVWDGRSDAGRQVASGVYFVRMRAGRFMQTRQMVLVK